jgi:hypothetical protein
VSLDATVLVIARLVATFDRDCGQACGPFNQGKFLDKRAAANANHMQETKRSLYSFEH